MTFVPVHHIERIEIVRGPQSSRYGNSGMAGVVHIITKKADCPKGDFCGRNKWDISNESDTGGTFSLGGGRTDRSESAWVSWGCQ